MEALIFFLSTSVSICDCKHGGKYLSWTTAASLKLLSKSLAWTHRRRRHESKTWTWWCDVLYLSLLFLLLLLSLLKMVIYHPRGCRGSFYFSYFVPFFRDPLPLTRLSLLLWEISVSLWLSLISSPSSSSYIVSSHIQPAAVVFHILYQSVHQISSLHHNIKTVFEVSFNLELKNLSRVFVTVSP